jgi:hypothetical protein
MCPRSEHLRLRARHPAGVASATYEYDRAGVVIGHAVLRRGHDGRLVWHVTDSEAPPFVVEELPGSDAPGWLLTRTDGLPFARILVAGPRPLDLRILGCSQQLVHVDPDGTLTSGASDPVGRIEVPSSLSSAPDAVSIEVPLDVAPAVRAAMLTLPLCLLPSAQLAESGARGR